jgi:hypothetical protein
MAPVHTRLEPHEPAHTPEHTTTAQTAGRTRKPRTRGRFHRSAGGDLT